MLTARRSGPSSGHTPDPGHVERLSHGRGMSSMIRNKLAAADQPPCGNRASGQPCALPMLHNGHHTRVELYRGSEIVQSEER